MGRDYLNDPASPLDIIRLKPKSISLHWEFMFTRARYETADMGDQGRLLSEAAALVDAGLIRSTIHADLGPINAANLKRAMPWWKAESRSAKSCFRASDECRI